MANLLEIECNMLREYVRRLNKQVHSLKTELNKLNTSISKRNARIKRLQVRVRCLQPVPTVNPNGRWCDHCLGTKLEHGARTTFIHTKKCKRFDHG